VKDQKGPDNDELERAREETSRLRLRLADARFAEDLKEALIVTTAAGVIAAPLEHSRPRAFAPSSIRASWR
jgi:hypothetical protein